MIGAFFGIGAATETPRQACPASRGAERNLAAIGQIALRVQAQAKALDHHWAELALLADELKAELKTIAPSEHEVDRFALAVVRQVNAMAGAADLAADAARIAETLAERKS
jgi:hypothetical protein